MFLVNQKEFCFLVQRALLLVTYPSSRPATKKRYEKALPASFMFWAEGVFPMIFIFFLIFNEFPGLCRSVLPWGWWKCLYIWVLFQCIIAAVTQCETLKMTITVHVQQISRPIRCVCASRVFTSLCKEGPFESTRFFGTSQAGFIGKKNLFRCYN